MSDFPSYPKEAAEREAEAVPDRPTLELAGWGSRFAAYVLDALILLGPLVVFVAVVTTIDPSAKNPAWAVGVLGYLATLVAPFIYFSVMHGGARGQTYGKRALSIRVVDDGGGPIGHGRAFGRYAITVVFGIFLLPLILDYLWPLWDARNQALHDKAVGSVVVRA